MLRRGQAVDDAEHHLAEDDDGEQPEALDQRVGGGHAQVQAGPRTPGQQLDAQDPGDGQAGPDGQSRAGGEEGGGQDHHHRHAHAGRIAPGDGHELRAFAPVLTPHGGPQQRLDGLEAGVHDGEGWAAAAGGLGGEHRQQDEDAHLDEDHAAGPPILTTMELEVQRPVGPRDPDQGEDYGELGDPPDRDVLGQVMGRLGDDGHIHQVVEEFEEADLTVGDRVVMGSRRPPEPALEPPTGLTGHGTG